MTVSADTLASYHLMYNTEHHIVDEQGKDFDRLRYSRMKYGDTAATAAFGHELAETIAAGAPHIIESTRPPELLVAYKAVPPACYYLSRYCLDAVNEWRSDLGNEPGRVVQIYKDRVAASNYAMASQKDRTDELNSIGFSLEGRPMDGTHAVILDDIRITGGAERKALEVLQHETPASLTLGYVALFDARQAAENPSVEMDLNASVIRGISDLVPLIKSENFDLNIRTLKMILGSEQADLEQFLYEIPPRLLESIARGALDTGVDFIAQYQSGFSIVRAIAKERLE